MRSLGGPSLLSASGEQVRFRTRKHFALLVRLALDPGKRFTRDYLTDLLWPSAAPRLANHSLAQGLSVIKAKVAREAVLIQRATVGLAPGWVDVDVHHLDGCDVEVGGPFLDGFEIAVARSFEEWKDECRARLLPQLRDCLVRQMDAARRIGDFVTVERRARRLEELDPLAEEAIRGVMEARAWAGDRSNALKAFARYETQLTEELGARPGADLVRMANLLREGRRAGPRPGRAVHEAEAAPPEHPGLMERRFEPETLIGREREFSVLYDAWIEARRKAPRIVVVTSDPGVGKTTLANAFVSSCQMDGAVVARAQAYDAERELPFAVLGELVKQLAGQRAIGGADPEALSELTRVSAEILHVFPGVPKPVEWAPEITPLRLADAFLKTVTAAADESPVVLVVDDVHAADNASTAILHVVARKLADVRVLLILTGRTSELRLSGAPAGLTSDAAIEGLRALELDVLMPEAAQRLAAQLAAAAQQPDPPIERILRASSGNPLAIELLTREWAAHGPESLLRDLEALDTQPVPTIGIPRAIGAVFDRQIRRLDPATRAALDLGAVLGRRLTDLALYTGVDLSPGHAAEALSRLKDEGLLREVRGDLEFRNELIRAQAYYAVAGPARQHLHRRVGELLAGREGGEDKGVSLEIAWHWLRGGNPAKAVPFALEGAEAFLAVGAPHEAEEILRAIAEGKQPPGTARQIRLLLAKALLDQSKADEALPIVEALVNDEVLTLEERAEAARLRASAEYSVSREPGETYCGLANQALVIANKTGNPTLIGRALFECARAATEAGLEELVRTAQTGIERLSELVDVSSIPIAPLTQGFCSLFLLDPEATLSHVQKVVDSQDQSVSPALRSFALAGAGTAYYWLCRFDESFEALSQSLSLARKVGDDPRASGLASNLCTLQMTRGDYAGAISFGELSVKWGHISGTNHPLLWTCYTNLADAYVLTGQREKALKCIHNARQWSSPERRWRTRFAFLTDMAAFALIEGNAPLALDITADLESLARGRETTVPVAGPFWKLRVFRAAHIGLMDEAFAIATRMGEFFAARCPLFYLDIVAARAWLERRANGRHSLQTERNLICFENVGAHGKRALLRAQGFLQ